MGRKITGAVLVFISCLVTILLTARKTDPNNALFAEPYTGSQSCRPCHERFYTLWATSHHGLAMQPFSPELAARELTAPKEPIRIGAYEFQAVFKSQSGYILERGPDGEKQYPIEHVMGGKNVYFFLTPLERGRLQVLPIAYDVRQKEWYNTTESMIRHFSDEQDQPVDWKDPLLTFNTACHNCHVSQLSTNYDLDSDTYQTVWTEPGINCETCHGPGREHIRICAAAAADNTPLPEDLKAPIIHQKYGYTAHQVDTNCSLCHTKGAALTTTYQPGDAYFDHYDLVTLEDPDFYPDGRDLGENYTYTLWRMSPCVQKGNLDCTHCHTSSGRFRFRENPNQSCLPCHRQRVENAPEHTHHPENSRGNQCIACHMPMTEFARMRRSDHSLRPPMPAATLAFQSPNACTLCHTTESPEWADQWVRKWRTRDYQKPVLYIGGLIQEARKSQWNRLDEMLSYLKNPGRDEIYANSLVRLLAGCPDGQKWPVILTLLRYDPSPLIRSSAAALLAAYPDPKGQAALLKAAEDKFRIVRIRAGAGLAGKEETINNPKQRAAAVKAIEEYKTSITVRPDHWSSHYNMGNFLMNRGQYTEAIDAYRMSHQFRPDVIEPLVNLAFAYNLTGRNENAKQALRKAAQIEPKNAAVHLNLALLLGETGRLEEAESTFRMVFKLNPQSAVAAYNLAVITASKGDLDSALDWIQTARRLRPDEHKYSYTHAFWLAETGRPDEAIEILEAILNQQTDYADAHRLLRRLNEQKKNSAP